MAQGCETGEFGRRWATQFRSAPLHPDLSIYYDHGNPLADASVVATKGFFGADVSNLNRLADIDILVASSNQTAEMLIEIEERACSPKKILGDVLAALICNRFAVNLGGHQHNFEVSPTTTLVVAGIAPDRGCRLQKIEQILLPRIRQVGGLPGGIRPHNVSLVFARDIRETIRRLDKIMSERFVKRTAQRTG